MKRSVFLLSVLTLSCAAGADCRKVDRVFVAPEYKYRKWDYSSGAKGSQNMWGVVGGYQHLASCAVFFRAWAAYAEGSTLQGDDRWADHEWEVEGEVGYTFAFGCRNQWMITPYTGLKYFQDYEIVTDDEGLRERIGSVPIGILIGWDINGRWNIQARAQANIEFSRTQQAVGDEWAKMSKKTDWLAELPITYRITSCWDLSLVPFYSFFPNANYQFPEGDTHEWGAINTYGGRLELGYSF